MIRLGTLKDSKEIYCLKPQDLIRHLCIFGVTGSGKSTTISILAYELSKQEIPCLILDRTGEFLKKIPIITENSYIYIPGKNFSISPFQIWEELPLEERVQNEVWLLEEYCKITWGIELSPLQHRILIDSLINLHSKYDKINFDFLIKEAKNIVSKEIGNWKESAEAIASRFEMYKIGKFKKAFVESNINEIFEALFSTGVHLIDLSMFENDAPKNLLSLLISTLIYLKIKMLKINQNPRLVLIIDEAQNIARKEIRNSIIEKIAMELRKYGLCLVLATTRPSLISSNILANAGNLIIHQIFSMKDIEILRKHAIVTDYYYNLESIAYSLQVGEAIIRTVTDIKGAIIKVGLKEHEKLINS